MVRHQETAVLLGLIVMGTIGGCGSDPYVLAPVSGRITIDGQPVAELRISFEPVGSAERKYPGPESVGITDDDGRYSLKTMAEAPRRGAVVGKCRVRISSLPSKQRKEIADIHAPGYDPVKEVKDLKEQLRRPTRKQPARESIGAIPLRYNDNTELSFDVPPDGTDKADFAISAK